MFCNSSCLHMSHLSCDSRVQVSSEFLDVGMRRILHLKPLLKINSGVSVILCLLSHCVGAEWQQVRIWWRFDNWWMSLWMHLVTDQVPLLFIVILPEEPSFIWRKVHRVLKEKTTGMRFIYTHIYFPLFCLFDYLKYSRADWVCVTRAL